MNRLRVRLLIGLVVAVALAWGATLDLTAAKAAAKATATATVTAAAIRVPAPAPATAKAARRATTTTTAAVLPSAPFPGTEAAMAAAAQGNPRQAQPRNVVEAKRLERQAVQAAAQARKDRGLKPGVAGLAGTALAVPDTAIPQKAIIHGDALSVAIAAASVIAKCTRDHMMEEYDRQYPGYGFAKHKGYPTREHYAALRQLGPSPIHRFSFKLEKDPDNLSLDFFEKG
jgi:hypothetical protein